MKFEFIPKYFDTKSSESKTQFIFSIKNPKNNSTIDNKSLVNTKEDYRKL
jgi:hypothetical protein